MFITVQEFRKRELRRRAAKRARARLQQQNLEKAVNEGRIASMANHPAGKGIRYETGGRHRKDYFRHMEEITAASARFYKPKHRAGD